MLSNRTQFLQLLACLMICAACSQDKGTTISVVEDAPGYNCWPMIQSVGDRLVCIYTIGKYHDTSEKGRGAYARFSDDGALTWSEKYLIDENPSYGTSSIGKGTDENGYALFWIRRMFTEPRMALYRTADGMSFEKVSTPSLNPNPMQVTDIYHTPTGLECLWFSDDYSDGNDNKSWGVLVSSDNGITWKQRIIEMDLPKKDWPTEPSVAVIGNGRLFAIARSEVAGLNQFQLTSEDWGKTWKKTRTNIDDVWQSTPTLVYDPDNGLVHNYYYQRGEGLLKVRTARLEDVMNDGTAWPEPEIIAEGGKERPYDSGNANVVSFKSHHFITYYSGDSVNCHVLVAVKSIASGTKKNECRRLTRGPSL